MLKRDMTANPRGTGRHCRAYFDGLVSGVLAVVAPPSALPACCSIRSASALSAFSWASLGVAAACADQWGGHALREVVA